jgi:hypothetical protein
VAEDRRGAYCVITAAGRAMRKRMWPVYQEAIERYFGAFVSDREATQLGEVLARVAHGVRAAPSEGAPHETRAPRGKTAGAAPR